MSLVSRLKQLLDPPAAVPPAPAPAPDSEADDLAWERYEVVGEAQRNANGSDRQAIVKRCRVGDVARLVREPQNRYDPQAVAVTTATGQQIGYLAREDAEVLAAWLDHGAVPVARIAGIYGGSREKPHRGVVLEVAWPAEEEARRPRETPTTLAARQRPPTACPACRATLDAVPERSRKCPACRAPIVVRSRRGDGARFLLTEAEAAVYDAERDAASARSKARTVAEQLGVPPTAFDRQEAALRDHGDAEPGAVLTALADARLKGLRARADWHAAKMTYFTLARYRFECGEPFLDLLREASKAEIQHYRHESAGVVKGLRVSAPEGSACATCRTLHGKRYTLDAALRALPVPNPACENGWCRCHWEAVVR